MRTILLLITTLFFLMSSFAQKKDTTKYFEGIIEYDIKSHSYLQGVSDNEIKMRTGAAIRFYFKEGNYMREYIDDAGYTIRKTLFLKEKNMIYDYNPIDIPDTLYYLSAAEPSFDSYTFQPGPTEKILDVDCPSTVITAKSFIIFLQDSATSTLTYFFNYQLPVNPDWHKDMHIWKEIIKIHKSAATKFIEDYPPLYKQTFTATKILWQPIDEKIFYIDPKLIQRAMSKF